MSGISVGTHGNQFYLNNKDKNVSRVDQLTNKAISEKGKWVSFSVKTPKGWTQKKFQVRAVQNDQSPDYQVEVRRGGIGAAIRRALSIIFSPIAKSEKSLLYFSQDLFSRYTLSQVAIEQSSQDTKPAVKHLFSAQELAQASQPFIDEHGHHVVMAPSQIIDKLNAQPGSKESMAVIFDLDDTLYTEGDYDGAENAKHTKSLDPELPAKLEVFKDKFPNAKLIIITQSPYSALNLVKDKLAQCGYKDGTFDILNTKSDPNILGSDGHTLGKKDERFSAIVALEKAKSGWSPQRVIFFDDSHGNLDDVKKVSDSMGIQFEGYNVQSVNHFKEHKRESSRVSEEEKRLSKAQIAQLAVTEKTLTQNLEPHQLHRYRMLRR